VHIYIRNSIVAIEFNSIHCRFKLAKLWIVYASPLSSLSSSPLSDTAGQMLSSLSSLLSGISSSISSTFGISASSGTPSNTEQQSHASISQHAMQYPEGHTIGTCPAHPSQTGRHDERQPWLTIGSQRSDCQLFERTKCSSMWPENDCQLSDILGDWYKRVPVRAMPAEMMLGTWWVGSSAEVVLANAAGVETFQ
jgi:hypothetical protein